MPRLSTAGAAILAVAGAAGAATAFVVALVGGYGYHHGLVASGRALAVVIPIAVGLHQWRRGDTRRYPALLVLLGFVMVLVGLAESWSSLAYSTGRVAGWAVEVLLIAANTDEDVARASPRSADQGRPGKPAPQAWRPRPRATARRGRWRR